MTIYKLIRIKNGKQFGKNQQMPRNRSCKQA
jgi:hypothetical protein